MTTLKTPSPDVLEYLQAVRATLADLPPDERDELMVDVETALLEAAEESERPLASRLGPPEDFAADCARPRGSRTVGCRCPRGRGCVMPSSRCSSIRGSSRRGRRRRSWRRSGGWRGRS